MPYLENKWSEYSRQLNPARRYSSQREFEADWVSGLRRRYALSQEALAVKASVSVTTVQNWENPQSHKNIAPHNQDRLRDIERGLWIKAHVTLLDPTPPYIRAIYELMSSNKEDSAQGLVEYLVSTMPQTDPNRARLLHWAGLTYSIADPASARARQFEAMALDALAGADAPLSAAIENEILGAQFEDLMRLPAGPGRQGKGRLLMQACLRLYERDGQPAYKWNALEVACRTPLAAMDIFQLTSELSELLGEARVQQRVMTDTLYEPARAAFAGPKTVN